MELSDEAQRQKAKDKADEDHNLSDLLRSFFGHVERWIPLLITLVALSAWEWSVRTGRLEALFFPAPSTIVRTLAGLFVDGTMTGHLRATLTRLLTGLAVGGIPGLLLGLAMGWSQRLRAIVDPFVAATHPIPKIAVLPLIMVLFGIGETSKVIAVAVAVFFPVLINSMAGVRQIDPIYFEVAESYGSSPFKVFTRIVLPGSLPMVLAGVRLALNVAMLFTIAVELVSAREGLGALIWLAWQTLRTEKLYAGLVVIAALGIAFNYLLQRLTQVVSWQED